MPPSLKKLWGILLLAHLSVRLCVCRFKIFKLGFEISYMDSSLKKIADPYFWGSELSPFVELCPYQRVSLKFCDQDLELL